MKLYTVERAKIMSGAKVEIFTLKAGIAIPAIVIGEEGRGRKLGVLPVNLLPALYAEWQEKGEVEIIESSLSQTKLGNPKLDVTVSDDDKEKFIVIMRTQMGFRGSNSHTGDWNGWKCNEYYYKGDEYVHCPATGSELSTPAECPECGSEALKPVFYPWPGGNICEGIIAQGQAGRMGSGEQLVSIMPFRTVFRVGLSGRLYGAPSAYYYYHNGDKLLVATWQEREILNIF